MSFKLGNYLLKYKKTGSFLDLAFSPSEEKIINL